jgi:hypothetical protein
MDGVSSLPAVGAVLLSCLSFYAIARSCRSPAENLAIKVSHALAATIYPFWPRGETSSPRRKKEGGRGFSYSLTIHHPVKPGGAFQTGTPLTSGRAPPSPRPRPRPAVVFGWPLHTQRPPFPRELGGIRSKWLSTAKKEGSAWAMR